MAEPKVSALQCQKDPNRVFFVSASRSCSATMSRVITRSFYVLIVVAASSDFCFWRELVHRIRIRLIRSLNHLITILLLWFRTFVRNFDSLDSFLASEGVPNRVSSRLRASTGAQMTVRIGNVQKCWEKRASTQHERGDFCPRPCRVTVKRGDNLVVVDFFSPGCDGCKALNPKICQLTEMNPDVQILQVNYEEHKSMCYSLNVHVLPFLKNLLVVVVRFVRF
ncbi:hypothetical protein LR48_Vigan01g087600 [Vigna angularis]|uniref:Thioredoxin domain-containing protein n=1 Tax=Phaseolus angularis TaxID=3914 RepID=A0A0L9TLH0_PHAAN|nr:hypothetical protein LR48_Vigan01g087600 [Vigna angularis]